MKNKHLFGLITGFFIAQGLIAQQCDTLSTTFAGGNGQNGNMFDIIAVNDITVTQFEGNLSGTNGYMKIYYKSGSYVGSETNPGAWTFIDSAFVTSNGTGIPTPIPVSVNVTIPAGQTYAFYVTGNNTGLGVNYTNGTTEGAVYSSDANLQIIEGKGVAYPFGGNFTPRVWNGIVHYCTGAALEATNDTSICTGNSVNLTVTITDSAAFPAPYTFLWSPADSLSCTACQSPVANPTSTTTYMVMVTDSSGAQDSAFVTVTIYSLPPVADAGLDTTICIGDSVQLNASGGVYYSWSPSTGLSDTNIANPYANPTITTAYEVSVSNGCGSDVDTVTITIITPPVDAGVDTSFCFGGSVILEALGATSFVWSPATGLSCTACTKPTASPSATTTYYVTGTDINGCINTDSVKVTVNGIPITAVSSADTICPGNPAQLDILTSGSQCDIDEYVAMTDSIGSGVNYIGQSFFANVSTIDTVGVWLWSWAGPNQVKFGIAPDDGAGNADETAVLWMSGLINLPVAGQWVYTGGLGIPVTPGIKYHVLIDTTGGGNYGVGYSTTGFTSTGEDLKYSVDGGLTWALFTDPLAIYISGDCSSTLLDSTATILWSPSTGLSDTAIANPLASPATTTTYTVSATQGGCVSTDSITIYIDTSNFITATPVTAICEGDSVQLGVTGTTGMPDDSTWVYTWAPGSSLTDSTDAAPLAFPASTTTYQITVSNTCGIFTDTVMVAVNPAPVVDAGVDTSYCFGGSVNLEALGAASFVWSPALGLSCTACTKPTASPLVTTTYYVTGTTAGCSATDSIKITVNGASIIAVSSTDSICQGDSAQLDVLIPSGSCDDYIVSNIPFAPLAGSGTFVTLSDDQVSPPLPIGFNFNFYCNDYTNFNISSNGFITFNNNPASGCCSGQFLPDPSDPNNLIAFAWDDLYPPGNGTIDYFTTGTAPNRKLVVKFTDIPYCCGATPEVSTQVILYETTNFIEIHTTYINNISPGTMGLENDSGTVAHVVPGRNSSNWSAANEGILFSRILSVPPDTTVIYSWSPSTGLSDPAIADPLASPATTTTYVVTADDNGCINTDTITVNVDNTIIILTPEVGLCTGNSVQLITTSNNSIVSWSWSPADSLSSTTIADPIANPSSTTTYTVTAVNAMACQFTKDVTVSVAPYPVASFTHSESALTVAFTNASVNADTWEWQFGDGFSSGLLNPTYTYDSAGTYNACLIVTNACSVDIFCELITVVDCQIPSAAYGYGISGPTVSFSDLSQNATGWSWNFGDSSAIDNNQNPTHTYSNTGTYNVCLTATNTCSSDSICNTISITSAVGIAESASSGENGVKIYPNPNSGVFTVEIYDLHPPIGGYDLRVYDVLNREIFNSHVVNRTSYIDLRGHPAGIYNLQVITDQGISNNKIIIE